MKKIMFLLTAAVIMITSLSACQPNPESDIVVQKDEVIKEAASDSSVSISSYSAPSNWMEDISYDKSAMKVKMNAAIECPSVQKFSSYKCSEAVLSQETLDALITEFCGSTPIYNADGPRSKEDIQKQILDLQLDIENAQNGRPDSNGNPIADPSFLKEWVKELKGELKTAPDSVKKTRIDTKLSELKPDKFDTTGFYGQAAVPGRGTVLISLMTRNPKSSGLSIYIDHDKSYLLKTLDNEEENQSKSLTREEATQKADALLKKIGIANMHLGSTQFAKLTTGGGDAETSNVYGYILTYVRDVDGITCFDSINYVRDVDGITRFDSTTAAGRNSAQYAKIPANEYIEIGVTKNGIVHFNWTGNYDLGDKITDNVALLPFDDIEEAFKKNMLFAHSYLDDPSIMKDMKEPAKYLTFYVYSIKLGYSVANVKNDPNHMEIIPVWNFYCYRVDKNGVKDYDPMPCMTINAADGGLI